MVIMSRVLVSFYLELYIYIYIKNHLKKQIPNNTKISPNSLRI